MHQALCLSMKYQLSCGLIIILSATLAGCSGDPGFGANLTVDSVESDSDVDYCGDDDGFHCDTLTVSVEVTGDSDFSTNMFYWEAVGDDGAIYTAPWVNGVDACAAGFTCEVTLDFDVANGTQLKELRWDDIFDHVDCPIEGVY